MLFEFPLGTDLLCQQRGILFHNNKENIIPYSGDEVFFFASQDGALLLPPPHLSVPFHPAACSFFPVPSRASSPWVEGDHIKDVGIWSLEAEFLLPSWVSQCNLLGFTEFCSSIKKKKKVIIPIVLRCWENYKRK